MTIMDMGMVTPSQQEIVYQKPEGQLRAVESEELKVVRALLKDAGMVPEQIAGMHVRASRMSNLSRVYLLEKVEDNSYLKIADKEGARGGFFIKFLNRGDSDGRKAGKLRRRHVRHLLTSVNSIAARQIVPQPLCFGEGVFEYCVPETVGGVSVFKDAVGCVMTRWKEVKGNYLQVLTEGGMVHDPISYSPETIGRLVNYLWEFQKLAKKALIECDKMEDIGSLVHEQRNLLGYQTIARSILSVLGLSQEHLEMLNKEEECELTIMEILRAKALIKAENVRKACEEVAVTLSLHSDATLQDISAAFLTQYSLNEVKKLNLPITSRIEDAPFQETIFYGDRDGQWPPEVLRLGRRISQLMVANEIIEDIISGEAKLTFVLLNGLIELRERYQRVEVLPKGIVHQDGHPHSFLEKSGELALIDPDDISWDVEFADLSNVYVYKIVRGFVNKKLDKSQSVQLLDAVLISKWIGEHAQNILDFNVVCFWNHCKDLAECYALKQSSVDGINVAVTLKTFINELSTRKYYDQVYRNTLLPAVPRYSLSE